MKLLFNELAAGIEVDRNPMLSLLASLELSVKARRHFHPDLTTPYACAEDLILRHGRPFNRTEKKPPVEPIPRACFHQAYRLSVAKKNSRWIYCEGYALNNIGLVAHHAWVTPRDCPGDAFDLAWAEERHNDAVYFGCMFKPEFVRETHQSSGKLPLKMYSVLDTWWIDYPLLTGEVKVEDVLWNP